MTTFHTVGCLIACLAQPPAEAPLELPEGVYGLTCRVVEVRGQDLLVEVKFPSGDAPRLRIKTTDASRFRLFDRVPEQDKPDTVTKSIRLKDLKKGQKVSVTIYTDGKEARLLSCIATGPNLGGERVLQHVADLGGKFKQSRSFPGRKDPPRWDIDLSGSKARDRDLLVLSRLSTLDRLDLSFTAVTNEGLKYLLALPALDDLNLTGTKVSDASVATLREFKKLRRLNVARSGFTTKGTDELLRAFPDLELCRLARGDKGQFYVIEYFRKGKLSHTSLMIGDTLFAIALPRGHDPKHRGRERRATTYYHREGPVGQILAPFDWFRSADDVDTHRSDAHLPASLVGLCARGRVVPGEMVPGEALVGLWSEPAVGVIRLNAGTYACYGRPLQFFDFYDNTPELQAFSLPPKGQPRIFNFVHDARARGCRVRILQGDERPTLARKGPKQFYSALFVDIARENLRDVNTSLMTKEGMAELMGSLREDGLLCYHSSHRYHQYSLPLADAANSLGYAWKLAKDHYIRGGPDMDKDGAHFSSEWFVVARKPASLDRLRKQGEVEWSVPAATGRHLWRDGQPHDLRPIAWGRK